MAKKNPKNQQPVPAPGRNRAVAVFISLVGTVTFTVLLLMVLAPPPLAGTLWHSLYAFNSPDTPDSMDGIFQTQAQVTGSRWKFVYIHHSRTVSGDAVSLAPQMGDHFVIGNGDGCVDGEIEMTQSWNHQQSIPTPPDGVRQLDPDCISICVVGDFDRTRPTTTQQRRLEQLVGTLQSKLGIPASAIQIYDVPGKPAGIGHAFPISSFRARILP